MHLKTWKKKTRFTYKKLAKALEVSVTTVFNMISGLYYPQQYLLDRLFVITNGLVTGKDFEPMPHTKCPTCGKKTSRRKKREVNQC